MVAAAEMRDFEQVALPPQAEMELAHLRLETIAPSRLNPRKNFDEAALQDLAGSIRQHGVLEPIVVRPIPLGPNGEAYEILCGERRWRAAGLAGVPTVPATIRRDITTDAAAKLLSLVENLQRKDIDEIEEAEGYRQLTEEFGLTQAEIAKSINRSQPTVANRIRLLSLPKTVQGMISRKEIHVSHGVALCSETYAGLPASAVEAVAEAIVRDKLPVSKVDGHVIPQEAMNRVPGTAAQPLGAYSGYDLNICRKACPHKAFRTDSWGRLWCLNPLHLEELKADFKAAAAQAERELREAAGIPEGAVLPSVSDLKNFNYVPADPPPGCSSSCPCRTRAMSWEKEIVEVCTDRARLMELQDQERQRVKEETLARKIEREDALAAYLDGVASFEDAAPLVAVAVAELYLCGNFDVAQMYDAARALDLEIDLPFTEEDADLQDTDVLRAIAGLTPLEGVKFAARCVLAAEPPTSSPLGDWLLAYKPRSHAAAAARPQAATSESQPPAAGAPAAVAPLAQAVQTLGLPAELLECARECAQREAVLRGELRLPPLGALDANWVILDSEPCRGYQAVEEAAFGGRTHLTDRLEEFGFVGLRVSLGSRVMVLMGPETTFTEKPEPSGTASGKAARTVHVARYAVEGGEPRALCTQCRGGLAREGVRLGEVVSLASAGQKCEECGRKHGAAQ